MQNYNPFSYNMGSVNVGSSQSPSSSTSPNQVNTGVPPINNPAQGANNLNSNSLWGKKYSDAMGSLMPAYNQEKSFNTGLMANQNATTMGQYNTQTANTENQLNQSFLDLNDKEGQNGTWGSSGRGQRATFLGNQYNNQLQSQYLNAQNDLYKQRSGYAYQYGDSALNQSNNQPVNPFQAQLDTTQSRPTYGNGVSNGNTGQYLNQGGFSGTVPEHYNNAAINYTTSQLGGTAAAPYQSARYTYGNPNAYLGGFYGPGSPGY